MSIVYTRIFFFIIEKREKGPIVRWPRHQSKYQGFRSINFQKKVEKFGFESHQFPSDYCELLNSFLPRLSFQ